MPGRRCVVQDCGNIKNDELGISIHNSPDSGSVRLKWKSLYPEEEVHSFKGSSAPEESADTMGAPNLNPEWSPEVEGALNASQGSLVEILEAEGFEKLQDIDEVMQIDDSLTIPEVEQVSMDTPTGHAGNCTTCKTLRTIQTDPWAITNGTELGLEDESEDEQKMQDNGYKEFECDEDPIWSPEEIENEYKKLKEDDDSVKTHQKPRHKELPNRLFNTCAHGDITSPRVWMTKASEAYEKLSAALNKTSLTKAIKKASSVEQTSALEGYHSVINQFAPKMYAFSYLGMFCRTILAALHFNCNIKRETKVDEVENPTFRVTYPKFKDGEATVREAKVSANYDYVADI
ncbi:hypothetical protein AWC38_SpisGene10523 [Stylophora pistillata]|uniref:Uncharacterized protein n=1 Tax=Stylophora pistillata TaxID=50429 RepID=A0A2B4S8I5_STYPI|nr:hypothetical protein AWC38_SpisGene10523 [Stylophora pistillata]